MALCRTQLPLVRPPVRKNAEGELGSVWGELLEGIDKERADVPGVLRAVPPGEAPAPDVIGFVEPERNIIGFQVYLKVLVDLVGIDEADLEGVVVRREVHILSADGILALALGVIGAHPHTRTIVVFLENSGIICAAQQAHMEGVLEILDEAYVLEPEAEAPSTH